MRSTLRAVPAKGSRPLFQLLRDPNSREFGYGLRQVAKVLPKLLVGYWTALRIAIREQ